MKSLRKSFKIGAVAVVLLLVVGGALAAGFSKNQNHIRKVDYDRSKLGLDDLLTDFETVVVEPLGFKENADKGNVKIELVGKEFELELTPTQVQAENAILIIETENGTQTIKAPPVYTYNGKVKGIPGSKVLLTGDNDVLLGTIYVNDEFFTIEQTNQKLNGKVVHIVYNSKMLKEKPEAIPASLDGDVIEPPAPSVKAYTENKDGSIGILATTTVDLLAGYDPEFNNQFSNPGTEIANMINNINNAYSAAEVSLSIKGYRYYTNIQSGSCGNVLSSFSSVSSSDRDSTSSDLAFLFSGKNFNGLTVGCSYGYGGGNANNGFATAQMIEESGTTYGASFQERSILTAHETGHNFDAGHQDNTNPDYARAYTWKYLGIWDRYTALWSEFKGVGSVGGMQLEFSDRNNHGDSTHDNVRRITETKTTVAGYR